MVIDYKKILLNTEDSVLLDHMKKFNISQKMLDESIDQIVSHFEMQPHMPKIKKDDPRIRRLLYISSYSIERTKTKLENLFTARSVLPEFFINRDIYGEELGRVLKFMQVIIMPTLTPEKYRITIFRMISADIDVFDFVSLHKFVYMYVDFRLTHDTFLEDFYIYDFSKLTAEHLTKINPLVMKKAIFITQDCYDNKIKSFNILSPSKYVQAGATLLKRFLKKKLADIIKMHPNIDSLHEIVPKECLPIEYGGTGESCQVINDRFITCIKTEEWRQKFIDYANEKSDESIRPESSKNNLKYSSGSIDGSFRTLDFD